MKTILALMFCIGAVTPAVLRFEQEPLPAELPQEQSPAELPQEQSPAELPQEPSPEALQGITKALWEAYKIKFGKSYETAEEDFQRSLIYITNLKVIEQHNELAYKGIHSYTMDINEFTDMETKEVKDKLNGFRVREIDDEERAERLMYISPAMPVEIPDKVDWRKHGFVTPVKNQGDCGSCWAFSTTGSLEGQHYRQTKKLVSLSEQNLVDCAGSKYENLGCNGGYVDKAFQYIKDNGGIDTEASYPYEAKDDKCHFQPKNVGASDKGFVDVPQDEDKLKEAVATIGPISIAIDANHNSFMHYSEGVYDNPKCSSVNLDHAVLIVGYGTEDGKDYWLVKNSWGTEWGEDGYIKMSRNKQNQCGVATSASYPLV